MPRVSRLNCPAEACLDGEVDIGGGALHRVQLIAVLLEVFVQVFGNADVLEHSLQLGRVLEPTSLKAKKYTWEEMKGTPRPTAVQPPSRRHAEPDGPRTCLSFEIIEASASSEAERN